MPPKSGKRTNGPARMPTAANAIAAASRSYQPKPQLLAALLDLTMAASEEPQEDLRNRRRVSVALEDLVRIAGEHNHGEVIIPLCVHFRALLGVVRTWTFCIRTAAEAGGAARAASASKGQQQTEVCSAGASSSSAECRPGASGAHSTPSVSTPSVSNAAGWTDALRHSSQVLGIFLGSKALNVLPDDPSFVHNVTQPYNPRAHMEQRRVQVLSILLRCGALPALSQLLAAEEHRGSGALLDTGTLLHAVQPVAFLANNAACLPPGAPYIQFGAGLPPEQPQQQQQAAQQLRPAVLYALADSGVVEHVCRAAARRLGEERQRRTGAIKEKDLQGHVRGLTTLLVGATNLACDMLRGHEGRGGSEEGTCNEHARTVLSSRGYQYVLHQLLVSQLHAVDGGTTYGLPYDQLLPPVPDPTSRDGPMVVEDEALWAAVSYWYEGFLAESMTGRPILEPPLGPHVGVELLLRTARAMLDSWRHSSGAGSGNDGDGGSGGGRGSGGGGSKLSSPPPRAVFNPHLCTTVAVHALRSAQQGMALYPARSGGGGHRSRSRSVRFAEGSSCSGASNGGGSGAVATAGCRGTAGGCSASTSAGTCGDGCKDASAGGNGSSSDSGGTGATEVVPPPLLSWAQRAEFANPWWRLAVGAVNAEVDNPQGEADVFHLQRLLRQTWSPPRELGLSGSAAVQPPPPPEPPAAWLSAAVRAGYLPCLERFLRRVVPRICSDTPLKDPSNMQKAPQSDVPPADAATQSKAATPKNARLLLELLEGRRLAALAEAAAAAASSDGGGEERQAASMLVTALKATALLAGVQVCDQAALRSLLGVMDAMVRTAASHVEAGGGGGSGGSGGGGSGGGGGQSAGAAESGRRVGAGCAVTAGGEQPVSEQQQEQQRQQQHQQQASFLNLVSLCLARWLPLCVMRLSLLPHTDDDVLRRPVQRMMGLVALALGAAEKRGDTRAADSWGQLLLLAPQVGLRGQEQQRASTEQGAGDGAGEGTADDKFDVLAPLLLPPCDLGQLVLPVCSNPLCTDLEGDSEAGVRLGARGSGGSGPAQRCCEACARNRRE